MKEEIKNIFMEFFTKYSDEDLLVKYVSSKAPFLLDEDGEFDEDLFLNNLDKTIEVLFPGLDKYAPDDVIDALMSIGEISEDDKYAMAFMLLPSNVLYQFMRNEYQNNRETFMEKLAICRDGQIELLAELGVSYKDMIHHVQNNKYLFNLYKLDNGLFDEIMEEKFSGYGMEEFMPIILEEYLNGSDYVLSNILSKLSDRHDGSMRKLIDLLIKDLLSINKFDVNKLIASLELSGLEIEDFISCVTDENVMRRMIEVGGARALVFCKNFSPEIVTLASDFTFEDYKMINGEYKNSPALLKLIADKYPDKLPIYYCGEDALTPETLECLTKIDDDNIGYLGNDNLNIQHNYLYLKELKSRGKYFCINSIDNLYTDINAFNFFIECLGDETGNYSEMTYASSGIIYYIFKKEFDKLADSRLYSDISHDVAVAIIDLGLDVSNYVKYFKHHDELSDVFLEQGHYEVLFMRGVTDKYLKDHSDMITFEMYLKIKEANISFEVGLSLAKRFIEQGHYEILNDIDIMSIADTWDLSDIGLDKMTYEEFLTADPIVRKIPALMLKFKDQDPSLFDSYALLFPDKDVVLTEKINTGSVTYEEFMEMTEKIDGRFNGLKINEDVILKYLKEGHLDCVRRLDSSCFTAVVLDFIIDNFDINNLSKEVTDKINYYLEDRLLERKDYSFLAKASFLTDGMIQKLINSGFTIDDFSKYGYDGTEYLTHYVSKENEDIIINIIKKYKESNSWLRNLDSNFIIKCINAGFELDNINYLVSVIDLKVIDLLKSLPKDKYDILNQLDIKNLFVNKTVTDVLLNILSTEKIKKSLAYATDSIRMYVIKKMVNLGYNDFIDCYVSGFDQDVVKKALLNGYFPSDTSLANSNYRDKIIKLNFTSEELDYLRTRLNNCPYLVMYFEDILNNPNLLKDYVVKEPGLLVFFNGEIVNNVELLYEVYKRNKELFVSIINRNDITDETIINLYLIYELDLNYIKNRLNGIIFEELVVKYPYLIDEYSYSISSDIVNKAFENGYKLNDNSKSSVIVNAFQYNFNQPGDEKYFDKVAGYDLNNLLSSISYEMFLKHKDLFLDKYFNDYYLYYYGSSFSSSDEKLSRYMNLTFYISSVNIDSITEEEKNIILEALSKFGNNKKYIESSIYKLINIFENDFFVKQFLDNHLHMSVLRYVTVSEEDKEAISNKIENDYKNREFSLDEKIELLSLFKNIDISNDFVNSIYDELYELCKELDDVKKLMSVFSIDYLYEKLMSDDSFEISLIENMRFYDDIDKNQMIGKRILELMSKNTYNSNQYYSICYWLYVNDFKEESNKLAMSVFELDPYKFHNYVFDPTPEFLNTIPKYLREYPKLIDYFDVILNDKELVIYLINEGYPVAYDKASEDIKNDIEVCKVLIGKQSNRIASIDINNPNYRELLKIALANDGSLLLSEMNKDSKLINDIELVRIAIVTYPNIIFEIDPNLIDDSLLSLIVDFTVVDFTKVNVDLFEKMLVVIGRRGLDERISAQIFMYVIQHSTEERLFSNEVFIKCYKDNINNPKLFKQAVILSKNKAVRDSLENDDLKVMEDALHILNNTGKTNTLEKNPIFSYDLVKYVYPVIGLEYTINLMTYTTNANTELIKLIKDGNEEFVKNYITMLKEYKLFENNDKFIHYAFRNFYSIKPLIEEVLESGRVLTDGEIGNLKNIILKNRFNVSNLNELSNYDTLIIDRINNAFKSNDLNAIKDYLAVFFGYSNIYNMKTEFDNFQFGNMSILKYVLDDIKKNYSEEIYNKIKITNEEMGLIILMQKIIESNDINFLKELVDEYIINNESDKDFYDDVQSLTAKYRLIMNYQFNARLTKLDDMVANASEYKDTGVKIVEFNGEEFNFLAHRLYNYDASNAGFAQMLMNDPSLWTTLDGASTLSCSSFSDKGFHFLNSTDQNGVVYLFNDLPESFMLFMYGRDLYVEHGGYKMEPTARDNSFTDIDGLNQNSCYHHGDYNEVAGFRIGMIPCAFVCLGNEPNAETIRAAQYFSKKLGKDIPIVKFNRQLYATKNREKYDQAVSGLHNNVSIQLIDDCFLSGIVVPIVDTTTTILDTVCRNLSQGVMNERDAVACLTELQSVINRTCLGGREVDNAKLALNKIAALKKTISVMYSLSKDEVVKIETANMGESGIMYKYSEGEDTYLLKPAVDKQKNEGQPFRALVQEAASKLQKLLNPESAVMVEAVGTSKFKISKQELIDVDPDKKIYLEEWVNKGGQLDSKIANQLMREYVVDMLLCNFDCFAGNFILDSSGNLRGVDKEQSFRFIDDPESLKPDFSYVPNGNARIPIYQYIFKRYNSGDLDISFDAVYETLDSLECLSDEDYKAIFEDYAKSLNPNNYEELLQKIVKRKHDVTTNIRRYIDSLISKKNAEEFRL